MKNKITVGLFGKLHGLSRKLVNDLPGLGFAPYEIDKDALAHPLGTVAVICTPFDRFPRHQSSDDQSEKRNLQLLRQLINSLEEEQTHLIYASMATTDQPEGFNLRAESMIRESGLPYTIVRVTSAESRPGHHHKLYWTQDLPDELKGNGHSVCWEDLSQVLIHCVNRTQAISKTFTLHSVIGKYVHNWDQWFLGLNPDTAHNHPRNQSA